MSRLKRVKLKGFKSIREMDLELGALNVLIGPNGAGKSNLLSFFRMLGAIADHRLQLFVAKQGGPDAILCHGRKRTPELEAEVHVDVAGGDDVYWMRLIPAAPDDLMLEEQMRSEPERGGQETGIVPGGGHRETGLFGGTLPVLEGMSYLERLVVYHFHDTSESAPIKLTGQLQDNRFLRRDGSNLAAFLYMLKQAYRARYDAIRGTIRMVAPFFDDFVLEPVVGNPNTILLAWRQRDSDTPFFAHQLSDGTLRFIALTTALLQPELPGRPRTILLDEPELGLHPSAINILAGLMQSASVNTQIIVATQSVTLLDALAEPEDVIVVNRLGGQSTFHRLELDKLEEWLKEYSLGELWEKSVPGFRGRP